MFFLRMIFFADFLQESADDMGVEGPCSSLNQFIKPRTISLTQPWSMNLVVNEELENKRESIRCGSTPRYFSTFRFAAFSLV